MSKKNKKSVNTENKREVIENFTDLKKKYDKRENPTDEDLKKKGENTLNPFKLWKIITNEYNELFVVNVYIQKLDGTISNKPEEISIKLMDEETGYFGFKQKGIYLGEFDDYAKYDFPNKYIKVKKYKDNDILLFHQNSVSKGGKRVDGRKTKYRRTKRKSAQTKKNTNN